MTRASKSPGSVSDHISGPQNHTFAADPRWRSASAERQCVELVENNWTTRTSEGRNDESPVFLRAGRGGSGATVAVTISHHSSAMPFPSGLA